MDASPIERPISAPRLAPPRLIAAAGLALALAYLVMLAGAWLQGHFLTDATGRPIANDFVSFYAAGKMALSGNAAAAYDWPIHRAAEQRALGHDFSGYYGWHNPPPFLIIVAALPLLPYLGAALAWLAGTLFAYTAALRSIFQDRAGIFVALGFPAAIWNVTAGQNGFLTAALIGGTLTALERRPALAGVLLGLLTYKPQFGLLFPLALVADRRWMTIVVAAAVASGMAAASWLIFGGESWQAFFHWLPITGQLILGEGSAGFNRLQSLYGLIRAHGGGEALAVAVQGSASLAAAVGIVWLWRRQAPYDLKAAALAAATLVATPYVYMYDLTVLAVAVGFLLRYALKRGFTAAEGWGFAAGGALILAFPYVNTQTGLAAVLIVLALIVGRLAMRETRMERQ